MSRRQTLGTLSPGQLNSRASLAPGAGRVATKDGAATKGRKSVLPTVERPTAATLAVDRRSSAFGGKPSGPKQDPRPLSDKNFLNNCIRTVITYLSTHNYPAAVSPKTLASPTAKDFTLMIQFIIQKFDPNMKTFGKIEDDVPMFFKRLNYPFQISKSALFAVGSPHSWPAVLAALTWLVELLNYNEKSEEAGSSSSSFDEESQTKKQFYEYICTSYRHYLAGDDIKCQAVDEDVEEQFNVKARAIAEKHRALTEVGWLSMRHALCTHGHIHANCLARSHGHLIEYL